MPDSHSSVSQGFIRRDAYANRSGIGPVGPPRGPNYAPLGPAKVTLEVRPACWPTLYADLGGAFEAR